MSIFSKSPNYRTKGSNTEANNQEEEKMQLVPDQTKRINLAVRAKRTFEGLEAINAPTSSEKKLLEYSNLIAKKTRECASGLLHNGRIFLTMRPDNPDSSFKYFAEILKLRISVVEAIFQPSSRKKIRDDLEQYNVIIKYIHEDRWYSVHLDLYEKIVPIKDQEGTTGRLGIGFEQGKVLPDEALKICLNCLLNADLSWCLITPHNYPNQAKQVEHIITTFENSLLLKMEGGKDQWNEQGKQKFREKVEFLVSRGLPINFILAGFPFKSPNTKFKVLGLLPDKAEKVALKNLVGFCQEIKKGYPLGAKINIYNDMHYADFLPVSSLDAVREYLKDLKKIVEEKGYDKFICFCDFGKLSGLHEDCFPYAKNILELNGFSKELLKEDKQYHYMQKFFQSDLAHLNINDEANDIIVTKSQFKKFVEKVTGVYFIYKQSERMLRIELSPFYIRISIHISDNSEEGFSVRLAEGRKANGESLSISPWHSAAVKKLDGTYCLMHKEDIEKNKEKYKLVFTKRSDGSQQPYYFREVRKYEFKSLKFLLSYFIFISFFFWLI